MTRNTETPIHALSELTGFFRDRNKKSCPALIVAPGPSLHAPLLPHLTQYTVTIGIGDVVRYITPTILICESIKEIDGICPRTSCLVVTTKSIAERLMLENRFDASSVLFYDEKTRPHKDPILFAIYLAYLMGLRFIHIDGVDTQPPANGKTGLPLSNSCAAWDIFRANRRVLSFLDKYLLNRIRLYSYSRSFSSVRVHYVDPILFWRPSRLRRAIRAD